MAALPESGWGQVCMEGVEALVSGLRATRKLRRTFICHLRVGQASAQGRPCGFLATVHSQASASLRQPCGQTDRHIEVSATKSGGGALRQDRRFSPSLTRVTEERRGPHVSGWEAGEHTEPRASGFAWRSGPASTRSCQSVGAAAPSADGAQCAPQTAPVGPEGQTGTGSGLWKVPGSLRERWQLSSSRSKYFTIRAIAGPPGSPGSGQGDHSSLWTRCPAPGGQGGLACVVRCHCVPCGPSARGPPSALFVGDFAVPSGPQAQAEASSSCALGWRAGCTSRRKRAASFRLGDGVPGTSSVPAGPQ